MTKTPIMRQNEYQNGYRWRKVRKDWW